MQEGDLLSFIRARSPMGLRLAASKNNAKYGITFAYFDIQQTPKGEWIAWFYLPAIKVVVNDFVETKE